MAKTLAKPSRRFGFKTILDRVFEREMQQVGAQRQPCQVNAWLAAAPQLNH